MYNWKMYLQDTRLDVFLVYVQQNDLRTEFNVHKAYSKIKCFVSLLKHDELPHHCFDQVINDIYAPVIVTI
jgi:hypothetical protein